MSGTRAAAARRRKLVLKALESAILLLALFLILFPIVWMALTAFKRPVDLFDLTVLFTPTLDNFRTIFAAPWNIGAAVWNSTVVAGLTVLISIPCSTMAAYAFSRFEMRFKGALFFTILATQFIPAVVVVLPFYLLFRDLGLLDTHLALVIVNLAIVTPFAVWMLKGFLDAVPTESEEAALVDGATRMRVILDIVVPMVWPGVLVTAVFCFILTWNEFLFALILTRDDAVTLPVGITRFRTERGDLWELIAAAGILISIPMFLLSSVIQRHFVRGMTGGAVK
ncbi:carbohydrate ABC transporter permease [Roseomonas frigidaquae]|uniref:Carbohydrate ABC transporter permease n=1 Tax=Falsiroseomonas frigidaquae TaxID=487318 RepID=A0ABX1F1L4_9PROT|nr:carbohydrate ABC transporter permease [Falsiroseomonas frigidaquae]NKE46189.1 carbohydrate ABC transporter permease [Falsiroseomonas frigidaquae]